MAPQVSAECPSLGAVRRQERAEESAWKGQKHINVSFGMRCQTIMNKGGDIRKKERKRGVRMPSAWRDKGM